MPYVSTPELDDFMTQFNAVNWAAAEKAAKQITKAATDRLDTFYEFVVSLGDADRHRLIDAYDTACDEQARNLDTRRLFAVGHLQLKRGGLPILDAHFRVVDKALFERRMWAAMDVAYAVAAIDLLSAEERQKWLPPALAAWRAADMPVRRFMGDAPYDY